MKRNLTILLLGSLLWAACTAPPKRPSSFSRGEGEQNPDSGEEEGDGDLSLLYSTGYPRLSHLQWENSVRDTLLLDNIPDLSKDFSADPSDSVYGNNASLLKVSSNLWSDYRNAAETIAANVAGNAEQLKKLTPASLPTEKLARAKAIISPLLKRAFRRPPTDAELTKLAAIFADGTKYSNLKDETAAGFEAVITIILQSAQFIYRSEEGEAEGGSTMKLTAYEVASRLSYAAWNSIPDEELFQAAESGNILSEAGLKKQAARLMVDKKGAETLNYWLYRAFNLAKYKAAPQKDEKKFPKWPKDMGNALEEEAKLFLDDVVVKNKGGLKEILTSHYTYVNELTAPLYGVDAPNGKTFAKVELDKERRSGFMTQLGYLSTRAQANETDPIHRGTFIVGEIFCTVMAVPAVTEKVPPASETLKTVRDRVGALTNGGSCGACHKSQINPAGFAFENYDATGAWQDMDNGVKVDASGEYKFPSTKYGTIKFNNSIDLIKFMVEKEPAHICYAQKALEMAYGRLPDVAGVDKARLQNLAKKSLEGASTQDIWVELLSDPSMFVRSNKEGATP